MDSSDSNISDANGNILGSVDVSSKDIAKVSLQLKDNDKVLFSQESDNIVSE